MNDQPVSLMFDREQHYACQNCPARCCRFPWKIALTQEEEGRLRQLDWVNERLAQFKVDFVPFGERGTMPRVEYKPNDMGCLFLDTDNLCLLQKREGHGALPKTCQTFPFAFLQETDSTDKAIAKPRHTYTATNFFCPSILNNEGEPMEKVAPYRFQQPDSVKETGELPSRVLLNERQALSQSAYLFWSRHIEQQFAQSNQTVPEILHQLRQTLSGLPTHLESQTTIEANDLELHLSQPPASTSPPGKEVPRHTAVGRTMVALGLMHAIANDPQKCLDSSQSPLKQAGISGKLKGCLYLFNLLRETGTIHLWDIPNAISMTAAQTVIIPEHTEAFQAELRRYYHGLFLGKLIWTLENPLPKTLLLLAASYATILRLTRYIAYSQGRAEATLQDLRVGIGFSTLMLQGKKRMQSHPVEQLLEKITDQLALFENTFERVLFCESER